MQRLTTALMAAVTTVSLTVMAGASPAQAVTYSTKVKDTHKDVVIVTPKVQGNQDVDIFGAFYQYYSTSSPKPQLAIELKLRKLDPARATTQLYVTEFKVGGAKYQIHANSKGAHAIFKKVGSQWVAYDNSCQVTSTVHPSASYTGGDILIYANFCWPQKRAKILWTQASNYDGLDLASYDVVTVKKVVGKP